jgi:glucose/arabinose dehydrogenase
MSNTRRIRPALEPLEDRVTPSVLPPGFTETLLTAGLNNPTAMELAPDGRLFVAEQGGTLRVVRNGALLATPFVSLNVDATNERGLLGVTFDPNFTVNHFVYVYYTVPGAPPHNRVSRFTAAGDQAVPGSEVPILDLEPLGATNHNGGAIHFGPDGKLYVGVGDNANGNNGQALTTRFGKLLRVNPDGSVPADNPLLSVTTGTNQAIYAYGLRNPFTFALQPGTGRLFINDVGQATWEEIDDGRPGGNYGWGLSEGPTTDPRFISPLFAYQHGDGNDKGCAITGGTFYDPTVATFPADYVGDYFFADLCNRWIRRLDPSTGAVSDFATDTAAAVVDLKVDSNGSLYYLSRGAADNQGAVYRIDFPINVPPNDNSQYLAGLYHDVLGRTLDPSGRNSFEPGLNAARAAVLSQVAVGFTASAENRAHFVLAAYQSLLGRAASGTDVSGWLQALAQGGTPEQVLAALVASPEYFQRVGSDNGRWLDQAYRDLLGRDRDAGSQTFLDALNRGGSRTGVALALVASPEYRTRLVRGGYLVYLGREPSAAEINGWLALLGQGGAANRPSPREQFFAGLLASLEFFENNGNADRPWVDALYTRLLGRPADVDGFNANLAGLLAAYAAPRQAAAQAVLDSDEARDRLVADAYTRFLGRTATAQERAGWVAALQGGATVEQVYAAVVSSEEYFNRQGGTNTAWLDRVYLDLLGRQRGANETRFLDALNNGSLTRTQVATIVLGSLEYRRDLIASYYEGLLGRSGSASEIDFWAQMLPSERREQVEAAILASAEYFLRTHPYP